MENPIKMADLGGFPLFLETSIFPYTKKTKTLGLSKLFFSIFGLPKKALQGPNFWPQIHQYQGKSTWHGSYVLLYILALY